jgi:rubrerythrin
MALETKFNVFEILRIAEGIEHKAALYYLKSVELFNDPERRDMLYKLANWRARHEKIWVRMGKRFSDKTGEFGHFDPDNYVLSNPQVMAGLTWFAAKPGSLERLTGRESKQELLKDAVSRSDETIIFYQGLKDFAGDPASKDIIDKLIKEETRHIHLVTKQLKQL